MEKHASIKKLDATGLEPPEPMVRIINELAQLEAGTVLEVTTHRDPVPLYALVEARGFSHSIEQLSERRYRLKIWRVDA